MFDAWYGRIWAKEYNNGYKSYGRNVKDGEIVTMTVDTRNGKVSYKI